MKKKKGGEKCENEGESERNCYRLTAHSIHHSPLSFWGMEEVEKSEVKLSLGSQEEDVFNFLFYFVLH